MIFNPLPQLPALPVLQDDSSMFDNLWTKIAVGTGQVKQGDIDAAKTTSNSTTVTPKAPDSSGISWQDIAGGVIGQATGANSAGITSTLKSGIHPIDAATSFIFTSRVIFLVIGLLLVGAGLFQFKATQTVIETGTKAAKGGAKLAATVMS